MPRSAAKKTLLAPPGRRGGGERSLVPGLSSMRKIVIAGAGISGLALAYRLARLLLEAQITVLEERNRPGGTIWTERREGFQIEIGANGFRDTKLSTLSLCRDLSLESRLVPASDPSSRNRFLFLNGKLRMLPQGPGSFLR